MVDKGKKISFTTLEMLKSFGFVTHSQSFFAKFTLFDRGLKMF